MKTLRITTKTECPDRFVFIGRPKVELVDSETGESQDITSAVRSCLIHFVGDDVVTAKVEMLVGELEIDGVVVRSKEPIDYESAQKTEIG